jgi:hypothetical protein
MKQRAAEQPAPAAIAATNIEPVDVKNLPQVWQKLLDALEARGPALHSLVCHGRLATIEDGRAVIRYDRRHGTFVKLLERNGKKDTVRDLLTQVTGAPLGVQFEIDPTSDDAPVAVMEAPSAPVARPVIQREARSAGLAASVASAPPPAPAIRITDDLIESLRTSEPLIKTLMDELGATIVKVEPPESVS